MGEQRSEKNPAPLEDHGKLRPLEAIRAEQMAEDAGAESPGIVGRPAQGVLTQVCIRCGQEYIFDHEELPAELTCERCGNTVFRTFFDVTSRDDVEDDFRASTERATATDDDANDVTAGDIRDLNNL